MSCDVTMALGQGTSDTAQRTAPSRIRQLAKTIGWLSLLRCPLSQGAPEEMRNGLAYSLQETWMGWHLDSGRSRSTGLPLWSAWSSISWLSLALVDVLHPLSHGLSATCSRLSASLLAPTTLLSATLSRLSATSLASTTLLSATCGLLSASLLLFLGCGLGRTMFVAGLAAVRMSDINLVFDRWRCGY